MYLKTRTSVKKLETRWLVAHGGYYWQQRGDGQEKAQKHGDFQGWQRQLLVNQK